MAYQCNLSAAIVAESGKMSFVFKVRGYSSAKELFKIGEYITSPPFSVGGHDWVVMFYPNGRSATTDGAGYIPLVLDTAHGKDVNVKPTNISILNEDGNVLPTRFLGSGSWVSITTRDSYLCLLINQAKLEKSGAIIDDCFSIKCDLALKKTGNQFVVVPPSDLHRHFGHLLESMDGADVSFLVGGDNKFLAHRFVLAARSSVFKAELLGAMREKADRPIEINEMEAGVFRSLLHFIYTDTVPVLEIEMAGSQGEAHLDVMMASHLLVAADRYNVERLKLICEHKLCSHIDANMVATSLVLAEQHSCHGLKEACLQFLASPSNLQAMMASDGYEHLKSSCPSVLRELVARLLPIPLKAAEDILMVI